MASRSIIDSLLDSVARCFNEETVRALSQMQADESLQSRIEILAEKANEGELTAEEREEYETFIRWTDMIAILQLKARIRLRDLAA